MKMISLDKNEVLRVSKSIMYKFISLGCQVYLDDWDNFLINFLSCEKCNASWNTSITECLFCGTENFHVYKCQKCGRMYSITRATKVCCGQPLIKICINQECISNKDSKISNELARQGGVFQIGISGSTLNEMRCKKCGNKTSVYKTFVTKIIFDPCEVEYNDILYINKISNSKFKVYFLGKEYDCKTIEEIMSEVMHIKS